MYSPKKLLIVGSCALLSLTAHTGFAQAVTGTRVGFKAGVSITTLDGVLNATPKTRAGLVLGPVLRLNPSKQGFGLQIEGLFSAQGANLDTGTETIKRDTYYFNVPILLRQYIGQLLYVNVGPQLGIHLGSGTGQYKPIDGAIVGGVGLETKGGLVLDARLNYGLSDINDDPAERQFRRQLGIGGLHNRGAQVTVGYLFGKK
ncbi:porin family protein [Hymenobacter pini]|uniref:porin family protein n=1 Tax=Hymenobacter pini TaxID=2880879 RepID=UPI001CF3F65B|nr:porin family protein [Hymenobacter pini]MCA8832348.1 PorT family protein [Hymenobacter pini]